MTALPKLTKKQQEILKLLYRFRFLNRIQIQAFLGHKDPKTINLWLRDLRAKGYVEWIYSTHFAEKTKPAVYYLGLNGVRYLRTLTRTSHDEDGETVASPAYPPEELRKRYKEPARSQTYIDRCVLIANCCITLERADTENEAEGKKLRFYYQTEADYLLERSYYQLDEEDITWKEQTDTEKLPIILFVCPRTTAGEIWEEGIKSRFGYFVLPFCLQSGSPCFLKENRTTQSSTEGEGLVSSSTKKGRQSFEINLAQG